MSNILLQAYIYLCAAVIAVPIAKRLGLGGFQVLLSMAILGVAATMHGTGWKTSLAIALVFSLSSTALVLQTLMIESLRKFGIKTYYSDATRPDLLHAAGIESAQLLIVTIDDRERAVELIEQVKQHHPQLKVIARAFDAGKQYLLKNAGVDHAIRKLYKVKKMVREFSIPLQRASG
jgi:voltage-gated potassium channel Kch